MAVAPLYRRVWRWHFMAGLMVAPFAIILAITGGIYLFKADYEGMREAAINSQSVAGSRPAATALPADDLLAAATAQYPGARLRKLTLAKGADDPTLEVELMVAGHTRVLFVDRFSATILADEDKSWRLMEIVKKIHGTLLSGNGGSYVVELMASWMIVLIISGIYLWWPRGKGWRHVFFPFLTGRSSTTPARQGWKRLHGAVGAWVGLMVLFLLVSGLPWTQAWGGGFKWVRAAIGQEGPGQEWFVTLQSGAPEHDHHGDHGDHADLAEHSDHHMSDGLNAWSINEGDEGAVTLTSANPATAGHPLSLQQVVSILESDTLPAPVELSPPRGDNGVWTARSMIQDRPKRETLHLDRWTGAPVMRITFADRPFLERLTSYGIAIHEGALFGRLNQLLGVIAAVGVVLLSVAGVIMWWRRRPKGQMAAPPLPADRRLPPGVWVTTILLAAFLPLFAASLIAALLADRVLEALSSTKA